MNTTASPTWATLKGHGRPTRILFFGQDNTAHTPEGIPALVQPKPGWNGINQIVDEATGQELTWGGPATRFWAIPVH